MRKAPRIGIIGLAGSGKDTVANLLRSEFPDEGFILDRFAAPLKRAARTVFGYEFDNRDVKEREVTLTYHQSDLVLAACIQLARDLHFTDYEEQVFQDAVFEQGWEWHTRLSPRKFQQILGTECVRKARPSAFVDRVAALGGAKIVPDVRFENETKAFTGLVLVIRPGVDLVSDHPSEALAKELTQFVLDDSADTHGAERMGGFKYEDIPLQIVYNTGSLEGLRAEVQKLKALL